MSHSSVSRARQKLNLLRWLLQTLSSHWLRHPVQLATLFTGLMLATALWSGIQALNTQARSSYDRAATLFGSDATERLISTQGQTFPQQLYIELRREGFRVSPLLEGRIRVMQQNLQLSGIDPVTLPGDTRIASVSSGQGSLNQFLTPPGQTYIAPETLQELGLAAGAQPLVTAHQLPPLTERAGLPPGLLVVDIGVAQTLLDQPGLLSALLIPELSDGEREQLTQYIKHSTKERLRFTSSNEEADLARLTDSFHLNLTALGLLAFVVGLFIVHAAMGIAFEQRRSLFRTLCACGVSRGVLILGLLLELLLLVLLAGAAGMIGGYLIAAWLLPDVAASLRGLYGASIAGQLQLSLWWWLSGFGICLLGALAASAQGLLQSYRLPLLSLSLLNMAQPDAWLQRQQNLHRQQGVIALLLLLTALIAWQSQAGLIAGFIMLAGLMLCITLLLPVLLGALLQLAERRSRSAFMLWFWADTRQQLSGLSLALMALLLALSANIGVGTMVEGFRQTFTGWIDQRLASEVYLRAENETQALAMVEWLEQRPEVEAVLPGWSTEIQLQGWPVQLQGYRDHATYRDNWPLLQRSDDAWTQLAQGSSAMISEQLARRLSLSLGDEVRLPGIQGDLPLKLVAIYPDYGNPKGQIVLNLSLLKTHWPEAQRGSFGIRLDPQAAPQLISDLQAAFNLNVSQVMDQASLKNWSTAIFERTFTATGAMNGLTLGVAGIALFSSLISLASSRLPQLAPVWALGITRRQLALVELLKTLLLASLTALLAIPLGLLLAWCLVSVINVQAFGWRLPLHLFPLQWLQLFLLAIITALLASIWPVMKLARTSPTTLLRVFADER
ncbi:FtsX-like permease family protein [Nitrincola sp. MINF-07-Sa-05]|uniref:FtsX-like permease family protein n=1 Tax=Nitrincola salilacus TaxID=3400273 RepID=UPI003917F844